MSSVPNQKAEHPIKLQPEKKPQLLGGSESVNKNQDASKNEDENCYRECLYTVRDACICAFVFQLCAIVCDSL